jgi:hypothetical protein
LRPSSLTFNPQLVNSDSPPQSVLVYNTGGAALIINSATSSGDFATVLQCAIYPQIFPGSLCSIVVVFHPTATGPRGGTLTINDNAPDSPQTVALSGSGVSSAPVATLSVLRLSFGNQVVGTASGTKTATLTNTGAGLLTITGISGSGEFPQNSTCPTFPATLNPGNSCTITILFKPAVAGTRAATVSIMTNTLAVPRLFVDGVGTSSSPPPLALVYSPVNFDFGSHSIGSSSASQSFTVRNAGGSTIYVYAISSFADYTETDTCTGITLAVGASCTVTMTFTPAAVGLRFGAISLSLSPGFGLIPVHGTGVLAGGGTPQGRVSPTQLAFGNQTVGTSSPAQTVTLKNDGDAPLQISSITLFGGQFSNSFSRTSTCPVGSGALSPGASCAIDVSFTPVETGQTFGDLIVNTDGNSATFVFLTGTGLAGAGPILQVLSGLFFPTQTVGVTSPPQMLTLSNIGGSTDANLSIQVGGALGEFTLLTNNNSCGSSLAAGASCQASVTFTPQGTGFRTGTVTITDSSPGSPRVIQLNSAGTTGTPSATLSTTSLSFGNEMVHVPSGPMTVTVTSTGGAPLQLGQVTIGNSNFNDYGRQCGTVFQFQSCILQIAFTPTATGPLNATLTIPDNTVAGSHLVSLSGTGTTPATPCATLLLAGQGHFSNLCGIIVYPLALGTVAVGTTGAGYAVTLSTSGAPLSISSISTSGDFRQTNSCPTAPQALAAGSNCTITVSFAPTALGIRSGVLTAVDSAAEGMQSMNLSGNGDATAPMSSLVPASLSFDPRLVGTSSPAQTAMLHNGGNGPLLVSAIQPQPDPPPASQFPAFLVNHDCGSLVLPGSSCTINVTFNPLLAGSFTSTLREYDNTGINSSCGVYQCSNQVTLSGTGVSGAELGKQSLDLGIVSVGGSPSQQPIILTNYSGSAVTISSVTAGGDFNQTNNCPASPATLADGASCSITVTFTPSATGPRTAILTVTDSATNSPQTAALSGFGAGPRVGALPAMANAAYGGYTTVTYVQNVGSAPANIAILYLDPNGNPTGRGDSATLAPNALWTVRQDNGNGLPPGGAGSGVILADQPVAAFVNEFAPHNAGDATSYSAIQLPGGAGSTLSAPAIASNAYGGYTTAIGLINLSSTATDITLTYRKGDGTIQATQTLTGVAPGAYRGVYSGNSGSSTDANLPTNFAGTATIQSSAGTVAAIVNEVGPGGQFSSYDAVAAGAATEAAPTILNDAYGGYNTAIGLQDLAATTAHVTISYSGQVGGGTATQTFQEHLTLAPFGYAGDYNGGGSSNAVLPDGFHGSATIQSDQPLASIVNEVAAPATAGGPTTQSTAYNTFAAGVGAAHLPLVANAGSDGVTTGVGIENISSGTASVMIAYYDATSGALLTQKTVDIAPGSFLGEYTPADLTTAGTRATAVISTSGNALAVIVNEVGTGQFMSYDAQ